MTINAYFYSDNGNQKGPVSFDDLKKVGISKSTLVWRDGFDDWQEAGSVPELSSLFTETSKSVESEAQPDPVFTHNEERVRSEMSELDNTKMFKNVFLFKGRARRSEFWVAYAIFFFAMMAVSAIADAGGDSGFVAFLCIVLFIAGFWLFLSEGTRRCHDLGHNGFWMLIPYYLLWMLFQNSKEGPNEYGNNPKGENFKKLY